MISPIELSPPPGWDRQGIDALLSALPSGRLSEIVGSRSSGASSLLSALLVRFTASGRLVALVDGADSFDPARAAAGGADLRLLLWVRCGGQVDAAFRATDLLARCPGFAAVALDLAGLSHRIPVPLTRWLRLQRAVEGSDTVLVIRTAEPSTGTAASLVLGARRVGAAWVGAPRPTRLGALVSDVRVLRSRHPGNPLPPGGQGEGAVARSFVWPL